VENSGRSTKANQVVLDLMWASSLESLTSNPLKHPRTVGLVTGPRIGEIRACRFPLARSGKEASMEVVHDCCFGLDVHKESVVTCLPCGDRREIRRFSTRTGDLKALVHRLREAVCRHMVTESTGVD